MNQSDERTSYEVILSPTAIGAIRHVKSRADLRRIDGILLILETLPRIGRTYDPLYPAAKPPEPILVAYAGNYGIYYEIQEESKHVNVLFIEDQRRNPLKRFNQ